MPDFASIYDCDELAEMANDYQQKFDDQVKACDRLLAQCQGLVDTFHAQEAALATAKAGGVVTGALEQALQMTNDAWRAKVIEMNAAADKLHSIKEMLDRINEARSHCQPATAVKKAVKAAAACAALVAGVVAMLGGAFLFHNSSSAATKKAPVHHVKPVDENTSNGSAKIVTGSASAYGPSPSTTVATPKTVAPPKQVTPPTTVAPVRSVEPPTTNTTQPQRESDGQSSSGESVSNTGGNEATGTSDEPKRSESDPGRTDPPSRTDGPSEGDRSAPSR